MSMMPTNGEGETSSIIKLIHHNNLKAIKSLLLRLHALQVTQVCTKNVATTTMSVMMASLGSSSSLCPSSKEKKMPMHTLNGSSKSTRSSESTTSPKRRKWQWHLLSLRTTPMFGGKTTKAIVRSKKNHRSPLG